MYTYDVVSESVRNPHLLAEVLTKRSSEGWEVVSIENDGASWFHAFIRHAGNVPVAHFAKAEELQPVGGPAAPSAPFDTSAPTASSATTDSASVGTPAVPANWYKDPSGRFELRYWNGTVWTEHVATGGKQSTDAVK